MVWRERFPAHKHGRRKRGQKFDDKNVFIVLSGKKKFSLLLAPLQKRSEKFTSAPPG